MTDDSIKNTKFIQRDVIIDLIIKAANRLNAHVELEPEWNYVGKIVYRSGITRFFRKSIFDLNTMAASEMVKDKGYGRYFLAKAGYPIAEGNTFFRRDWAERINVTNRGVDHAWDYAKKLGLPVFVNPNSKSKGEGVAKVYTKSDVYLAAQYAVIEDKVFLVERALIGDDYRFVVLDGDIISAYRRIPLKITGDGMRTILELLHERQECFRAKGRAQDINIADRRIAQNLLRAGFDQSSILEAGYELQLLDNANLSTGGESVDVTANISQGFRRLAKSISIEMGLRLIGLDLIVDGSVSEEPVAEKYWIIEVNSAPGLDSYASMGKIQKDLVEDLYARVIAAMERPNEAIDKMVR